MTNALGYFVNLVGDVVGGSVPPNFDKSTQGSSFDLVANVICENAKETPWDKTFAEEQALPATTASSPSPRPTSPTPTSIMTAWPARIC